MAVNIEQENPTQFKVPEIGKPLSQAQEEVNELITNFNKTHGLEGENAINGLIPLLSKKPTLQQELNESIISMNDSRPLRNLKDVINQKQESRARLVEQVNKDHEKSLSKDDFSR